MKRHGAALVVTAVVAFLSLGSGSRADDDRPRSPESCKTDLWFVFDWCESPARWPRKYISEGHVAAFQAGCVMHLCPEQITCTELDPMWCGTPCEDPTGATFWRNLAVLGDRCGHLSGDIDGDGEWEPYEDRAYRGCADAEMKALCPASAGTRRRQPRRGRSDMALPFNVTASSSVRTRQGVPTRWNGYRGSWTPSSSMGTETRIDAGRKS